MRLFTKKAVGFCLLYLLLLQATGQSSYWGEVGPNGHPANYTNDPNCFLFDISGAGIFDALEVNPSNPNEMYAGSASGALFYTKNGGANWEKRMGNLPFAGIVSITAASNFQTLYMSLGGPDNYGVKKSTDGGKTWGNTAINLNQFSGSYVSVVKVHPSNPNKAYAVIGDQVYVTTDGGSTWPFAHKFQDANQPNKVMEVRDIIFKEDDLNTVYFAGAGLYKIDIVSGSEVWNDNNLVPSITLYHARRINIAKVPTDYANPLNYTTAMGNTLYGVIDFESDTGGVDTGILGYSLDAGVTWNLIPGINAFSYTLSDADGINSSRMELVVAPGDPLRVFIGSMHVWEIHLKANHTIDTDQEITRVFNGILTMNNTTTDYSNTHVHDDIRDMQIVQDPSSYDAILIVACDGGVSSENISTSGISWNNISGNGLNGVQCYGIGGSETNPDLFVSAQAHSGLCINTTNGMKTLRSIKIGDGGEAVIDPGNNNFVYASSYTGNMSMVSRIDVTESYDCANTGTFYMINPTMNPKPNGAYEKYFHTRQPMMFHTSDNSLLFAAFKDLWSIKNPTASVSTNQDFYDVYTSYYTQLSFTAPGENIVGFDIAPSDINYIYYITSNNGIIHSSVGGGSGNWVNLTNNFSTTGTITDVAVNPNDKNDVWISTDEMTGTNRLLRLINGVWIDLSSGLPDYPVTRLKFMTNPDYLLAGTGGAGVYILNMHSITTGWQPFNNNLPNLRVSDIDLVYANRKIRIATYGVGVWESPMPCNDNLVSHIMTPSDPVLYANTTVNWSYGNYVIPSGYTLTIDGATIKMPMNGRFTVQPGGKFILKNGARITNGADLCAYMWDGIYVEGDPTQQQVSNPVTMNYPNHGYLELKDATLENAYMAVSVGYNMPPGSSGIASGGVVTADNATFQNNRFSARFYDYSFSNKSRIRDCHFICTGSLPCFPDHDGSYSFVSLFGVKDIFLSGNTFENIAPGGANNPFGSKFRGAGIISINSTYWVTPSSKNTMMVGQCTVPIGTKSQFKGLTHGVFIYNLNNDNTKQAHILDCDFIDISMGIGMNFDTKTVAVGNNFTWSGDFDEYPYFPHPNVSIKSDYSEGMYIAKNMVNFSYSFPTTGIYGIAINECNYLKPVPITTLVYKNNLTNSSGNTSGTVGLKVDGIDNSTLHFECNDFTGFNSSVNITSTANIPSQGNGGTPSGNKFNDNCGIGNIRLDVPLLANPGAYGTYYYDLTNPSVEYPDYCAFSNWPVVQGINIIPNQCLDPPITDYYCPDGQGGGDGDGFIGKVELDNHNSDPFTTIFKMVLAGDKRNAKMLLPQLNDNGERKLSEFILNLYEGGGDLFHLKSEEKSQLLMMLEEGNDRVKESVRGLLLAYACDPAKEHYVYTASNTAANSNPRQNANVNGKYVLFPNPAENKFSVDYTLPGNLNTARIEVRDMLGRMVWSKELDKNKDIVQVNIDGISGLFICTILDNKKVLYEEKVVLNK